MADHRARRDTGPSAERILDHRGVSAAVEAYVSSLERAVLSRHEFTSTGHAQGVVLKWCYGFYNHERRHSAAGMASPIDYENTAAPDQEAA